ncbi:MAG: hypothetical protein KJ062_10850 [Thermoanaerobaculia bacterium]|nr:hypothetical protein [Thermoanaerobaculia bacterium]
MVLAAGAAQAQVVGPIQFTEPELPPGTVVNGLTLSTLNGVPILPVSFAFEVGGGPSVDCTVSGGPGTTTYVSDPSMEGAPGTLTIQLSGDANDFRFGFAVAPGDGQEQPPFVEGRPTSGFWTSGGRGIRTLGTKGVGALAVTGAVQLTGFTAGGAVAGTATFDALDNPGDDFPGNLAALSTVTPFRRVVVQWNAAGVGRFALDNLAVRQVAGLAAVPALSGAGLAALAAALVAAGIAILRFRG